MSTQQERLHDLHCIATILEYIANAKKRSDECQVPQPELEKTINAALAAVQKEIDTL